MGRGRWKNCRDCAGEASIGSITGTSSNGWCGSQVRFESYRYREESVSDEAEFRMAYDALKETVPGRSSKSICRF